MFYDSLQLDLGHKGKGWGVLVWVGTPYTGMPPLGNGVMFQGHLLIKISSFIYRNNEAKEQLKKINR